MRGDTLRRRIRETHAWVAFLQKQIDDLDRGGDGSLTVEECAELIGKLRVDQQAARDKIGDAEQKLERLRQQGYVSEADLATLDGQFVMPGRDLVASIGREGARKVWRSSVVEIDETISRHQKLIRKLENQIDTLRMLRANTAQQIAGLEETMEPQP